MEETNMNNNELTCNRSDNNNFDMQTLINIVGQSATTVQGLIAGVDETRRQIGLVATQMVDVKNDVSSLSNRMFQIENNEEITTEQVETIKKTAISRIREILGKDEYTWAKYFRTFIKRIYSDARANAGCGSKVDRTRKCNFQRVVDYMESWNPDDGVFKLMQVVDERAEAKKKAREEGYDG